MTDFSKVLNPEQCAAATAADGPILVLAAAGTGKTRTLVHRVAYLVEKGVSPERILLLTFTNRAAKEMMERAEQLVGPAIGGVWSGTFHHVCSRFLRRYGGSLGYGPGYQILDEDDAKKLMAECIKKRVAQPKDFLKKELVLKIISDAANRETPVANIAAAMQSKEAGVDVDAIVDIAIDYAKRKKELGVMDFDDLLVNALKLLRENANVRVLLQDHFQYVLVDEYQDTNTLQAQLVDIIAAKSRNVLAVGDDFQCIYTWRGAQFENIMEFPNRWPGCRIIKLERNYRSVPSVLDVANVVMKDVPHQFEKTLRAFRQDNGSLPCRWSVFDGKSQADLVAKIIDALRDHGYGYGKIAVLYRSHFNALDIQMKLMRSGVPFRITSGTGFFEQVHAKDALAFLRIMVDPKSELSFMRVVELLPGAGEAAARKAWEKVGKSFDPCKAEDREKLRGALGKKALAFYGQLEGAFEEAAQHHAEDKDHLMVDAFLRGFYIGHLRREYEPEEADRRADDLKELQAHILDSDEGLKGFLREVALLTNLDAQTRDRNAGGDCVTLSTVHQAKGMEWPAVIVPWLVEGLFPSKRSMDEGNADEERRLFYVAVTRAKDRLYLIQPRARAMPEGGLCPCEASRFLREIPPNLVTDKEWNQPSDYGYGGGYGGGGYGGRYGGGYGRGAGSAYNGRSAGGGYGRNSSRFGRW